MPLPRWSDGVRDNARFLAPVALLSAELSSVAPDRLRGPAYSLLCQICFGLFSPEALRRAHLQFLDEAGTARPLERTLCARCLRDLAEYAVTDALAETLRAIPVAESRFLPDEPAPGEMVFIAECACETTRHQGERGLLARRGLVLLARSARPVADGRTAYDARCYAARHVLRLRPERPVRQGDPSGPTPYPAIAGRSDAPPWRRGARTPWRTQRTGT